MDDLSRLKILLSQYLLFRDCYYDNELSECLDKIIYKRTIDKDAFYDYLCSVIRKELFNVIFNDIDEILNLF